MIADKGNRHDHTHLPIISPRYGVTEIVNANSKAHNTDCECRA